MHYTGKSQRRKALGITLTILAFLIGGIAYSIVGVHDLSEQQDENYEELSIMIEELAQSFDQETNNIRSNYDQKLERMGTFVLDRQKEYEAKTQDLINLVEETERSQDIQLNSLKEELSQLGKADLTEVADKAIQSSVTVTNSVTKGSGAILTEDGFIATNNHVVKGLNETEVIDSDGNSFTAAVIIADPVRDLAIIKAQRTFDSHLAVYDSSQILVGERVLAIGNPQGLEFTVTQGIVSAGTRTFNEDEGSYIQTDVPINAGSSGGPLVNSNGELIGINTFKIKGSESLGFAIPSNDVLALLAQVQ